ncbi:hypothetical protein ACF0H5_021093 [Mactra antiquata]
MNYNHVYNFSSSDDGSDNDGYTDEDHERRGCKYIYSDQDEDEVSEKPVRLYVRKCICGNFYNRRHILNARRLSFTEYDGKEIHTSDQCKWYRRTIKRHGQKKYRLWRHCVCKNKTQDNSQTRSINSKLNFVAFNITYE